MKKVKKLHLENTFNQTDFIMPWTEIAKICLFKLIKLVDINAILYKK